MTAVARVAWLERATTGDRHLLVIDLRPLAGLTVAGFLVAAPVAAMPLGRLSAPFALLVVLPPLALALEAFGWRDDLASRVASTESALVRLVATYALWIIASACLTLDVAAVAAASVGLAVARDREDERRWQLGSAVLGANVGSLLFPFSNLTNLILVSASGIGFTAYVGLAVAPQVAAALAVGSLLVFRAHRSRPRHVERPAPSPVGAPGAGPKGRGEASRTAGGVALAGAAMAVIVGLLGGDMAVPFAASAAVLAGFAVGSGRLHPRRLLRAIPFTGLAIIGLAAGAGGLIGSAATRLPSPDAGLGGLALALAVGGIIAVVLNNLPAAAFGAVWLARAHPATIVAFLIGTNVVAVATPHGSMATILARATGGHYGTRTPAKVYVRSAWLYAVAGAAAAGAALALVAR